MRQRKTGRAQKLGGAVQRGQNSLAQKPAGDNDLSLKGRSSLDDDEPSRLRQT
jgi:hypothetical protein